MSEFNYDLIAAHLHGLSLTRPSPEKVSHEELSAICLFNRSIDANKP
jgi:hypothetical protein